VVAARLVISVALIGATLSALHRDPLDDGFPISTYPMFAQKRGTKLTLVYGLGVTASGATRPLPSEVTGTGEVLQAAVVYEDAAHAGPKALAALCAAIAGRVASDIVSVRIVEGTHDAVGILVNNTRGAEHFRAACQVPKP
jgi:hypothetical protein